MHHIIAHQALVDQSISICSPTVSVHLARVLEVLPIPIWIKREETYGVLQVKEVI